MLRAMGPSEDQGNDRRAVPRHLRDGENDLLSSTGAFGQRAKDVPSRGRGWALIIAAVVVAVAAGWFFLR
jgi:hypothetical protein